MDIKAAQDRHDRATVRSKKLYCPSIWGWLFLLFVTGCVATEPMMKEPVTVNPPESKTQTVTHLDNGRKGFVVSENPVSTESWQTDFDRSVFLMQNGRETDAIPILEEIVSQSPGVTAPYINLAIAYSHAERFKQAEELLKTALQLVPDHPVANNEYGLLLRQTGRFEEARQVYEETLNSFPEYSPVRRNLGILCELYLRDSACALEQYSAYIEANPDDEDVAVWIADLNLRKGRN